MVHAFSFSKVSFCFCFRWVFYCLLVVLVFLVHVFFPRSWGVAVFFFALPNVLGVWIVRLRNPRGGVAGSGAIGFSGARGRSLILFFFFFAAWGGGWFFFLQYLRAGGSCISFLAPGLAF